MKNTITILIVVVIIGVGAYFLLKGSANDVDLSDEENTEQTEDTDNQNEDTDDQAGSQERGAQTVLGASVESHSINAYHYGDGDTELLLVGGIHGGYEWNTSLLAYEVMDYLEENPNTIPSNMMVTVVPVLNPDGLASTVGTAGRFTTADVPSSQETLVAGRFNGRNIDLNRNFDCDWQTDATWQDRAVSGGTSAFSEPESRAIRDYITQYNPEAVVVYYSAAGGVFASSCHNDVLPETRALTNEYADASGYPAYEEFDFYEITGDMVNWLARENIPAISVLLTDHQNIEWDRNRRGIEALLSYYAN